MLSPNISSVSNMSGLAWRRRRLSFLTLLGHAAADPLAHVLILCALLPALFKAYQGPWIVYGAVSDCLVQEPLRLLVSLLHGAHSRGPSKAPAPWDRALLALRPVASLALFSGQPGLPGILLRLALVAMALALVSAEQRSLRKQCSAWLLTCWDWVRRSARGGAAAAAAAAAASKAQARPARSVSPVDLIARARPSPYLRRVPLCGGQLKAYGIEPSDLGPADLEAMEAAVREQAARGGVRDPIVSIEVYKGCVMLVARVHAQGDDQPPEEPIRLDLQAAVPERIRRRITEFQQPPVPTWESTLQLYARPVDTPGLSPAAGIHLQLLAKGLGAIDPDGRLAPYVWSSKRRAAVKPLAADWEVLGPDDLLCTLSLPALSLPDVVSLRLAEQGAGGQLVCVSDKSVSVPLVPPATGPSLGMDLITPLAQMVEYAIRKSNPGGFLGPETQPTGTAGRGVPASAGPLDPSVCSCDEDEVGGGGWTSDLGWAPGTDPAGGPRSDSAGVYAFLRNEVLPLLWGGGRAPVPRRLRQRGPSAVGHVLVPEQHRWLLYFRDARLEDRFLKEWFMPRSAVEEMLGQAMSVQATLGLHFLYGGGGASPLEAALRKAATRLPYLASLALGAPTRFPAAHMAVQTAYLLLDQALEYVPRGFVRAMELDGETWGRAVRRGICVYIGTCLQFYFKPRVAWLAIPTNLLAALYPPLAVLHTVSARQLMPGAVGLGAAWLSMALLTWRREKRARVAFVRLITGPGPSSAAGEWEADRKTR